MKSINRFILNFIIFLLSFSLIGFIFFILPETSLYSSDNQIREGKIGFLLFLIFSIPFGILFSLANFIDDSNNNKKYYWIYSIIGGGIILSGITITVFYIKRIKTSFLKKALLLFMSPIIINFIILLFISICNKILYNVIYDEFIDNLIGVSYFSISTSIPTVLLGLYNMRSENNS